MYKAYLGYHAKNGLPETVVKKFKEYKDRALRNSTSSDLHAIVVHALHDTGDIVGMVQVASELRARGRLAMTTAESMYSFAFCLLFNVLLFISFSSCFLLSLFSFFLFLIFVQLSH